MYLRLEAYDAIRGSVYVRKSQANHGFTKLWFHKTMVSQNDGFTKLWCHKNMLLNSETNDKSIESSRIGHAISISAKAHIG